MKNIVTRGLLPLSRSFLSRNNTNNLLPFIINGRRSFSEFITRKIDPSLSRRMVQLLLNKAVNDPYEDDKNAQPIAEEIKKYASTGRCEGLNKKVQEALDILRGKSEENKKFVVLKEGDLLIINNRKILHGRNATTSQEEKRWLQRVYIHLLEKEDREFPDNKTNFFTAQVSLLIVTISR